MKTFSRPERIVLLLLVILSMALLNYPGFDLTFGVFNSGDGTLLWPSVTGTIINALLFYLIVFYLIPRVLRRQGLAVFLLQFLLCFSLLSLIEILIDLAFLGNWAPSGDILFEVVVMVVVFNVLTALMALAYRFARDWFENEKQRISVSEWQARTELDMLRNQINPHFLFNALNNLFSMSLKSGDEKTAEGIAKLSEMMRYVFDKSRLDRVALEDEIQYIEDYIYLQKLRFEDSVTIHTDFSTDCQGKRIAPMLLIPFVENAFKYGVNATERNTITCRMVCEADTLHFILENKIVEDIESIPSSGIGLQNVRKRLGLVYPGRHRLEAGEKRGMFNVNLMIEL